MDARLKEVVKKRPNSSSHKAVAVELHDNFDRLAFPGGLTIGLSRLKRHETSAIERAIDFLDADPWFLRSGFVKEEILTRLKSAPLTDRQRKRLAGLVLRSLTSSTRRVFNHYARLAAVVQSGALTAELSSIATTLSDPEVERRAEFILALIRARNGDAANAVDTS